MTNVDTSTLSKGGTNLCFYGKVLWNWCHKVL